MIDKKSGYSTVNRTITNKKGRCSPCFKVWQQPFLLLRSVTTLFGFAAFDFARLFIVPAVTQFFEGSLFVKLLFQPTQSAVDDLTFFDADFGMHRIHQKEA